MRLINELLKVQATTDVLTGICNRQKFYDILNHEIQESRRYRHPLSLIMFDIDFFKQINDRYGHKVGDDVLRETARLISDSIRDADVFARWGGEEFMILSPHSELKSTGILADKLRALVEQHRYHSYPQAVTCSFGIAAFLDIDTVESFTNRADSAKYMAKKTEGIGLKSGHKECHSVGAIIFRGDMHQLHDGAVDWKYVILLA